MWISMTRMSDREIWANRLEVVNFFYDSSFDRQGTVTLLKQFDRSLRMPAVVEIERNFHRTIGM